GQQRSARRMVQRRHEAIGLGAVLMARQRMPRADLAWIENCCHRRAHEGRFGRRALDPQCTRIIGLQLYLAAQAGDLEQAPQIAAEAVTPRGRKLALLPPVAVTGQLRERYLVERLRAGLVEAD